MSRSWRHACWQMHVNGVAAPSPMRYWLTDQRSLTAKLVEHSRRFDVRCLSQGINVCLADEHGAIGRTRRTQVRERDVLLQCDGEPVVFAHTVIPLVASAADWPFFSALGNRSLGTTLFNDPRVIRGPLSYARLRPTHPLAVRARAAANQHWSDQPLFARRSLFRRAAGVMLVTEVFLPAILALRENGVPAIAAATGRSINHVVPS